MTARISQTLHLEKALLFARTVAERQVFSHFTAQALAIGFAPIGRRCTAIVDRLRNGWPEGDERQCGKPCQNRFHLEHSLPIKRDTDAVLRPVDSAILEGTQQLA